MTLTIGMTTQQRQQPSVRLHLNAHKDPSHGKRQRHLQNFVGLYKEEFGFSANAAATLYDMQMLKTCSTLSELDDNTIASICKAVSKDTSQSFAKVAATRLKLVCFWIKHQYRISREIGTPLKPLVRVNFDRISLLQLQKHDKVAWVFEDKEPKYTSLTLDTSSAMKVFDKVKNLLAHVSGVTGVPLVYVIRVLLIPEDEDSDPHFGEENTKYTSIDMAMTAHTPILSNNNDYKLEYKDLEAHGLFVSSFLTDTKKVWSILLACFGASSAWQHVKKFAAQQNGRQAWCTLHNHFFGGDKINTMVSDILTTLKSLHCSGDCKNFNIHKYCTAHVEQHNHHAAQGHH